MFNYLRLRPIGSLLYFLLLTIAGLTACAPETSLTTTRISAQTEPSTKAPPSGIAVLYLSAYNCPPCWSFNGTVERDLANAGLTGKVDQRTLKFATYAYTNGDSYWPPEYRWVRDVTFTRGGAPRLIVIADGKVLANHLGAGRWRSELMPLIQELVVAEETRQIREKAPLAQLDE